MANERLRLLSRLTMLHRHISMPATYWNEIAHNLRTWQGIMLIFII